MRRNKLGAFFLVSTLALAGVGVSYAGFTDYIQIYATVENATVHLSLVDYSCTLIFKVWNLDRSYWEQVQEDIGYDGWTFDFANEVCQYHGFYDHSAANIYGWGIPPNDKIAEFEDRVETFNLRNDVEIMYEFVSWAKAMPCTAGNYNEVDMEFDNVFPCKDFIADFVFHYDGSIPARIIGFTITPWAGSGWLINLADLHYEFYDAIPLYDPSTGEIRGFMEGDRIPIDDFDGLQIHFCDHILVKVVLHLDQDNRLQGLEGGFTGRLDVRQWYDPPVGDA